MVFLVALACAYAFFFEYLPGFRWVHVPFDLEDYHLPLADFAFRAVRQFRLPQWDPTMYSGVSFLSNVQSAFFYPGTWLMFVFNWSQDHLSHEALQDLTLAHVPLAFTLCFFWLRGKVNTGMAAMLGAAAYAFSGYMCEQLQHFGLIVAYAWIPLGLQGIDEAAGRASWRPLWKVAVAASLAFLGGYPPVWLVFAVVAGVYALAGSNGFRTLAGTVVAFVFSLGICGVQLLPTWDAARLREPEARYGAGMRDPDLIVSYLIPNSIQFGLDVPVKTNREKQYLYLGAPGILGVFLAFRRKRAILPALMVVVVCVIVVTNPFDVVWRLIRHSPLLADIVRSYYFLAGVTVGLTALAAQGLDWFLTRQSKPVSGLVTIAALVAMSGWAIFELVRWPGSRFAYGRDAILDPVTMLAVFAVGLFVLRGQPDRRYCYVAVAVLLAVGIDYKVFGTSIRLNARVGPGRAIAASGMAGMNPVAFAELRPPSDYRVLLHDMAPFPTHVRHTGWRTPQGFDPLVRKPYLELGRQYGSWTDDRRLVLDPMRPEVMQLFGIRHVITTEEGTKFSALTQDSRFRIASGAQGYFRVFEYLEAKPIYQFPGRFVVKARDPENRLLAVESEKGGRLTFAEQGSAGWSADLDGTPVPIQKWETAFQAVEVPPGAHTVRFQYRERLLLWGAMLSLLSTGLLIAVTRIPVRRARDGTSGGTGDASA